MILWNNALVNALSTRTFADAFGDALWKILPEWYRAQLKALIPPLTELRILWR